MATPMKAIYPLIIMVMITGCGDQHSEQASRDSRPSNLIAEPATTQSAEVVPRADLSTLPAATTTPAPKQTPRYGPKTKAASFEPGDGGVTIGDAFVQSHFNTISGYVEAEFAPKTIVFNLSTSPASQSVPKATIQVFPPTTKKWEILADSVIVKADTVKEFKLEASAPGRYAFRVVYFATEPEGASRPPLIINSVELKE